MLAIGGGVPSTDPAPYVHQGLPRDKSRYSTEHPRNTQVPARPDTPTSHRHALVQLGALSGKGACTWWPKVAKGSYEFVASGGNVGPL